MNSVLLDAPSSETIQRPSISPLEAGSTINNALTTYSDALGAEFGTVDVQSTLEIMQENNMTAHNRNAYEKYGLIEGPIEPRLLNLTQKHVVLQALRDMEEYGLGEQRSIDLLLNPKTLADEELAAVNAISDLDEQHLEKKLAALTEQLIVHRKMASMALEFFVNEHADTSSLGPDNEFILSASEVPSIAPSTQAINDAIKREKSNDKRSKLIDKLLNTKRRIKVVDGDALPILSGVKDDLDIDSPTITDQTSSSPENNIDTQIYYSLSVRSRNTKRSDQAADQRLGIGRRSVRPANKDAAHSRPPGRHRADRLISTHRGDRRPLNMRRVPPGKHRIR